MAQSAGADNVLRKIEVLKKGIREERQKNAALESEVAKLKEDGVIKQEQIDKLKEELIKFRDKSSGRRVQNFIKGFFDEEERDKVIEEDNPLEKENIELKDKIESLLNEKNFINSKLNESLSDYNNLKEKYESQIVEIQKKADEQVIEVKKENEAKILGLQKEIWDKNKVISEQTKSIKGMSEICKSFDMQKFNFETQINEFKAETEKYKTVHDQKVKEVEILMKNQTQLVVQIEENQQEIMKLKDEINQYKNIIAEMTPITKDYVFQGKLLGTGSNSKEKPKKLDICFGKYEQGLCFKEEGHKEKVFSNYQISEILQDKKYKSRLWIYLTVNGKSKSYLCEFPQKEIEYILKFYGDIKVRPDYVENALMNVSLGDYFY